MMRVHASGHTDVGQVREANEDAFHVGDSVFAVADGDRIELGDVVVTFRAVS